jgi:hypothetical protein
MGRRIFEGVVGVLLVIVAFVLAYFFQQSYKAGVEYMSLPVPVEEIPPYILLTDKMFEMKDFPSALTGGYAGSIAQLAGRISNSRIPAGLPIPLVLVSSPEDFRLADPALEVLSIPINPQAAIGGQVRAGDKVNIYRLISPGSEFIPLGKEDPIMDPVTLVASNIPVVMVIGDSTSSAGGSETGRGGTARVLIVAVTGPERDAILTLMGELSGGAMMWITLAPIKS